MEDPKILKESLSIVKNLDESCSIPKNLQESSRIFKNLQESPRILGNVWKEAGRQGRSFGVDFWWMLERTRIRHNGQASATMEWKMMMLIQRIPMQRILVLVPRLVRRAFKSYPMGGWGGGGGGGGRGRAAILCQLDALKPSCINPWGLLSKILWRISLPVRWQPRRIGTRRTTRKILERILISILTCLIGRRHGTPASQDQWRVKGSDGVGRCKSDAAPGSRKPNYRSRLVTSDPDWCDLLIPFWFVYGRWAVGGGRGRPV